MASLALNCRIDDIQQQQKKYILKFLNWNCITSPNESIEIVIVLFSIVESLWHIDHRHQTKEENLFEKVQLLILSNWIDQTTTLQIIAFRLAETTMWNNMVRHGTLNIIIKLVPCTFYYIILFNCVSNVVTAHTVYPTIVHCV